VLVHQTKFMSRPLIVDPQGASLRKVYRPMIRKFKFAFLAALVVLGGITTSQADSVGSLGFSDIGPPYVRPTNNINTATQFTIGSLVTTTASSGIFAGLPTQILGSQTFDITNPASLSFGNSVLGQFQSTSITEISNSAGQVAFSIIGNFTGGSFTGATTPNPAPADFTISFTQTPAGTGSISDSATMSIPATLAAVPEPASVMLVGLGLVSVGVVGLRRKSN